MNQGYLSNVVYYVVKIRVLHSNSGCLKRKLFSANCDKVDHVNCNDANDLKYSLKFKQ